jgi:hypothetical protein
MKIHHSRYDVQENMLNQFGFASEMSVFDVTIKRAVRTVFENHHVDTIVVNNFMEGSNMR